MRNPSPLFLAAGLAISSLPTNPAKAADVTPVLSLSALAVGPEDPAGPARGHTGSVNIVIDRWSAVGQTGGDTPSAEKVGEIWSGSDVVANIQSAAQEIDRKTKARRIVITTDRPVSAWKFSAPATPTDVATSPAEPASTAESTTFDIRVSEYGTGEGRLVQIGEPYAQQTLRLAAVSVDLDDTYPLIPR